MSFSINKFKPKFLHLERKQNSLNQLISITIKPNSKMHGLIIQGSPGVGKSYSVEAYLKANKINNTTIKGTISPSRLFTELYVRRHQGDVMVLDDSDSILDNEDGLNILKAATDTTPVRKISRSLSKRLPILEGMDNTGSFEYKGTVIVITNSNFDNHASRKLKPHLMALKSRCYHIVMDNGQRDEAFTQIVYAVTVQGMLDEFNFTSKVKLSLLSYMESNLAILKDCSLRTVYKLAELAQEHPDTWNILADFTFIEQE